MDNKEELMKSKKERPKKKKQFKGKDKQYVYNVEMYWHIELSKIVFKNREYKK